MMWDIFSIGAQDRGVVREGAAFDYAPKHSVFHIVQPFRRVWSLKKLCYSKKVCICLWKCWCSDVSLCVPYFGYDDYAVNNENMANKVEQYIGKPYCSKKQVLYAKWTAPDSFICSSLAWYIAKEYEGTNLGDYWTPSIFPAGIYCSDRVWIVK